jgi:hypothetical protein
MAPGHGQQQIGREKGHRLWPFWDRGQLCHRLWPIRRLQAICKVGIGAMERQHPLDVALGEALLLR